jgi:hypothetical protein
VSGGAQIAVAPAHGDLAADPATPRGRGASGLTGVEQLERRTQHLAGGVQPGYLESQRSAGGQVAAWWLVLRVAAPGSSGALPQVPFCSVTTNGWRDRRSRRRRCNTVAVSAPPAWRRLVPAMQMQSAPQAGRWRRTAS